MCKNMINTINTVKAVVICAAVNAIYTFYVSSTAFMAQVESWGEEAGRIESFIRMSEVTEKFWPHLIKGWALTFGLSLFSCLLLLFWIELQTHNNRLQSDAATPRA